MQDVLERIGLSKNEAKVYLSLSQIGLATAYKVANTCHIDPRNAIDAIERLKEKGLVSEQTAEKHSLYAASDPGFLLNIVDKEREEVNAIVPILRIQQKSTRSENTLEMFKGVDPMINILTHWLDFKEPILLWGVPKTAYPLLRHRVDIFHKERIRRKIPMYHIYNYEGTDRIKTLKKFRFTPVRRLPSLYDAAVATNVCGNEVMLINFEPPITTYHIVDKSLADTMKKHFKILWKQATK